MFPQIHLHNTNAFFEDLSGKDFYNLAYKLHFLHTDLPMLHKWVCFSTTIPPLLIYQNTAMVKFVPFSQEPSSQDLCVNVAHIRSNTFHYVRKYIKFVKVSLQVLIKWYTLLLNAKTIKT